MFNKDCKFINEVRHRKHQNYDTKKRTDYWAEIALRTWGSEHYKLRKRVKQLYIVGYTFHFFKNYF